MELSYLTFWASFDVVNTLSCSILGTNFHHLWKVFILEINLLMLLKLPMNSTNIQNLNKADWSNIRMICFPRNVENRSISKTVESNWMHMHGKERPSNLWANDIMDYDRKHNITPVRFSFERPQHYAQKGNGKFRPSSPSEKRLSKSNIYSPLTCVSYWAESIMARICNYFPISIL